MLLVLGGHDTTLGGLLDREADTPTLQVQVDDLDPEFLGGGDHLLGQVDVVGRHLRDVHKSLYTLADLYEGSERHQLGDTSVDQLAHLVRCGELLPRILLGGLQGEADALAAEVDLQDLYIDLVAYRHHRTGVVDMLPGQFGDVDQSVHAAQVHEGAEVHDAGYDALADLAGPQVVEELLALFLLVLFQPGPA